MLPHDAADAVSESAADDADDAPADATGDEGADADEAGAGGLLESVHLSTLDGNAPVLAISVRGELAVLGRAHSDGPELVVVRLEPPERATPVGALDLEGTISAVVLEGSRVYLATSDDSRELAIVDVSNPGAPALIGAFDAPGSADGTALDAAGNRVIVGRAGGSHAEIVFVDATDASAPIAVASADVSGDVRDIEMYRSVAYVATSNPASALVGLDYSDLAAVTTAWSLELPGGARALDLNESRLYVVAAGEGQGYLAELEAPAQRDPFLLSLTALEGEPSDIVAYGNHVLVAVGGGGVLAFDRVRPPALKKPALVDRLDAAFGAQALAFDDQVMLVGGASAGSLELVRAWLAPRIIETHGDGYRTVSILGDSNSGRPAEPTWVNDLFGLLAPGWKVVNRAEPDALLASSNAFSDAWEQLETSVANDAPEAVVLAFGTNDIGFTLAFAESFGTVPGEAQMGGIVSEFVSLRQRCEHQGLLAFIALTPPAFTTDLRTQLVFELNHQLRNAFDPAILLDFHSSMRWPEDYLDGLHVGPTGAAKRALEAWRKFEPERAFAADAGGA